VSRPDDDDEVGTAATAEDAEVPDEQAAGAPPVAEDAEERGLEPANEGPSGGRSGASEGVEDQLRAEIDELRDQLLRRRAEFENYRRRVERERAQTAEDAVGELLTELLPTIDNLERAATAAGDENSVREGVGLILRTLQGLLGARGVAVEDPAGEPFDPERHQALAHEPAPGHAEGTIVEVFQKGYRLGGRLLRPALVKVAKGEPARAAEDGETLH